MQWDMLTTIASSTVQLMMICFVSLLMGLCMAWYTYRGRRGDLGRPLEVSTASQNIRWERIIHGLTGADDDPGLNSDIQHTFAQATRQC